MDNDVDAVVLACRGTLASWSPAVEAVAYEQARVNAESPLDRGAALRRRVEDLSTAADATPSLATGFDRLAAERGWGRGMTGCECRSRVVALARPYADVAAALEDAVGAGLPLVVVAPGDPVLVEGALRPFDGAFDAILTARELGAAGTGAALTAAARWLAADPRRLLYVSASRVGIAHAGRLGMRRAWVNRASDGRRPPEHLPHEEWSSLRGLGAFLGVSSPTLPVAS
jgi:FMN phosphatase YigB (HAD superfamily)